MLKYLLVGLVGPMMLIAFFIHSAVAFVAQNPNAALSFNNTSRTADSSPTTSGASSVQTATESPEPQVIFDAGPIDYSEIADKLLPNIDKQKLYVDLTNKSSQNILTKNEQTFFIILPEISGSSWIVDEDIKLAKPVNSWLQGDKRIFEFQTSCCGDDTFFLDNLTNSSSPQKVLQTKIIRLHVLQK